MQPSKSIPANSTPKAVELMNNLVKSWKNETEVEDIDRQLENIIGKDDGHTLAFLKNSEAVEKYISVHFKTVLRYEFRNPFDKLLLSLFSACSRLMQSTAYLFRFMNNPQTSGQLCKLWELMLRKNLTQFMSSQLKIGEMVGHDVSYRLSTPKAFTARVRRNGKDQAVYRIPECWSLYVGND